MKCRSSNFDGTLIHRSVIVAICCDGCYKATFMGACEVGMVFVKCAESTMKVFIYFPHRNWSDICWSASPFPERFSKNENAHGLSTSQNHTHHTGTHNGHFVTSTTTDSNNYWPVNERMMEIGRSTFYVFSAVKVSPWPLVLDSPWTNHTNPASALAGLF